MRASTILLILIFTVTPVASVTAQADGMKPGLWEVTSKTKMGGGAKPAMPVMTPDQLAQMKSMGIKMPDMAEDQAHTIRHCVTKEQAEKSVPPSPKDSNGMHCEQQDVKRQGNKVSWKLQCAGKQAVTGSGSMVYESPERYTGTSTMTSVDPQYGPMTISNSFSGKWLSATCK